MKLLKVIAILALTVSTYAQASTLLGKGAITSGGMNACASRYVIDEDGQVVESPAYKECSVEAEAKADADAQANCKTPVVRISDYTCSATCQRYSDRIGKHTYFANAYYKCN